MKKVKASFCFDWCIMHGAEHFSYEGCPYYNFTPFFHPIQIGKLNNFWVQTFFSRESNIVGSFMMKWCKIYYSIIYSNLKTIENGI